MKINLKRDHKKSFTLIELIITIVVLGIILIPLGIMSMEFTREIVYSKDLVVAKNLSQFEMAKIYNLTYSDTTLNDGYDNTTSNYNGYAYDLRRTVNIVGGTLNNLKKIQVRVYPTGNTIAPLVNLITYRGNIAFGAGSGGGGGSGNESDKLSVAGGSISGANLQNVTLTNTDPDNSITITGVIISFTGTSGIKLKNIYMNGGLAWTGTKNSGSTVTLDTSFTLAANTSYNNPTLLNFSKNLTSVTSLVFIMSDASQTSAYSWP